MRPILDTHQHLWDLSRLRLPWLERVPKLDRSFVMDDYLRTTAGLNVVRTVYMEVDAHPSQHVEEAEYVFGLCQRTDNPMAAAVISGRPAEPGFAAYLDRFHGVPYLKGVRQVLHGDAPRGCCLQPAFVHGIRLLGERGLSFDLCVRPGELADAAALLDACPETRFILDHCGNADVQAPDHSAWQRDIAEIARRQNVVCKVSGIVASAVPGAWTAADLAPIVGRVLREFGPDRVMFGGDWPVCTLAASYRQWVEALQSLVQERSETEQRKLFHDNAAAFYGIA